VVDVLERVTNLLALLLESRPLTMQQIVDRLEGQYPTGEVAARAAFERDKSLLREVGVPIDTEVGVGADAGRTLYSIDRRRYELPDLGLSDDERAALQLAVAASRSNDAQFGLFKLGGAQSGRADVIVELPESDALPTLHGAIAQRSTVSFDYRNRHRALDPYTLLLRESHWYLVGFDHGYGAYRTYRVDRMSSAIDVGEPGGFERHADYDVHTVFPKDIRQLGADERTATVRVDDATVEVPCANADAFRAWLFSLGTRAQVVAPSDVRADVVAWLTAVAR
jgi:proteasome accessory factor B